MTLTAYTFLTFIAICLGVHSHFVNSVIEASTSVGMLAVVGLCLVWRDKEIDTYNKPERDETKDNSN